MPVLPEVPAVRDLALVTLVLWIAASIVFVGWKSGVAYPSKPGFVKLISFLWEATAVALAIWVLSR